MSVVGNETKMGLLKPVFQTLTAAAMAGSLLAFPAAAQDAANTNAPVVKTSATVAPAAMTKPQYVGVSDWTINDARLAAENVSHNKVAIVVWGGTQELQLEAYKAAQDLVNEGVPVAFVLAPDHNTLPEDAVFQVYAKSAPISEGQYFMNGIHEVRGDTYSSAKSAHRANFPQQVAQLDIR